MANKKYLKKWYLKNKEKVNRHSREYYEAHKEERKEYFRRYYRMKQALRAFYEANLRRTPGIVYHKDKDCICNGVIVRYYGTKIAALEDCTLNLYAIGYSASTTFRHNILKKIAEERGWVVKAVKHD